MKKERNNNQKSYQEMSEKEKKFFLKRAALEFKKRLGQDIIKLSEK